MARQLRELRGLAPWSWDARLEEHPPGEKTMHDFENVLAFQMEKRRRTSTATPTADADDSPAGMPGSNSAKRRPASTERGTKRASPAPPSGDAGKAARKGSKAARVDSSPASQQQQQQQQVSPSVVAPFPAAPAASPATLAAHAGVEATPAVRAQQQQQHDLSPAPAAEVTPAVHLAGPAHTPATAAEMPASLPNGGPPSAGGAAALADAQFQPTPAPTPMLLAGPLRQPSVVASMLPAVAPAAMSAERPPLFRAPAPRGAATLTSLKRKAEDPAAPAVVAEPAAPATAAPAAPGAALAAADSGSAGTAEAAAALDMLAGGEDSEGSAAEGPRQAVQAAALVSPAGAAPMEVEATPAAPGSAPAALPPPAAAAAAPAAPAEAGDVHSQVPTPIIRAFAAADQLLYHQPRPASCPPLFKQAPAGSSRRVKSPLGKQLSPAAGDKENSSLYGARLTPRTAEPAAPQQVVLSAWKQRQQAALSANFHTRQRRLLELLSACNRATAATPAGAAPAAAAGSGGRAGRGAAAAVAVPKPPLGPRAAAVAAASCWAGEAAEMRPSRTGGGMGRALGRLQAA